MDHVVLTAQKRAVTGSADAARLRRNGKIPAVVYGRSGQAMSIVLDALDFGRKIKGVSESTLLNLSIDGAQHEVFIKDTQRDIFKGSFIHVDFYEVEKGKTVHAKVPVRVIGTAEGVRLGGILEAPLHELEVECLPKDLPEHIDIDVTNLKANEALHVRDLKLASEIRVLTNPEQVVALVKFAKAEAAAETTVEAAAETAAPAVATEAPKA
ncbi:50S ribosomal protein L25 [Gracilinema caldarium]|uniref:Large ribosomal subunit protein bL25 n=1 Tax=Gracilinema caldarium (strain ATCC 51460 / DSM 7334 / H1) TaxID=744872 RepID=F8F082_GRAC1|nr:50S ribosomal protein L25 [Gracilinema caldarium]AEJ18946.1 50S ribosomal protein L25 [Gracilinema caldarium DSM 7334]